MIDCLSVAGLVRSINETRIWRQVNSHTDTSDSQTARLWLIEQNLKQNVQLTAGHEGNLRVLDFLFILQI